MTPAFHKTGHVPVGVAEARTASATDSVSCDAGTSLNSSQAKARKAWRWGNQFGDVPTLQSPYYSMSTHVIALSLRRQMKVLKTGSPDSSLQDPGRSPCHQNRI